MEQPTLTVNGKIWLEIDQLKILGPGRVELLERIHSSGSIRQAALQMKMSYKQAWDLVNQMNTQFKTPLVISHRGGKGGGNAVLTTFGIKLIAQFHLLMKRFKAFLLAIDLAPYLNDNE